MDAQAELGMSMGLPTTAIQWGAWSSIGSQPLPEKLANYNLPTDLQLYAAIQKHSEVFKDTIPASLICMT